MFWIYFYVLKINIIYFSWLFWLTLFSEYWLIQLIFIFTLFYFIFSQNLYFSLIYFFFIIIELGCFLGIINLELLSGFLWLIEFTIFFILLILFFFLNNEGFIFQFQLKISVFLNFWFLGVFYLWLYIYWFFFLGENFFLHNFCINEFYINFYESIKNFLNNDFIGFKLSYYDFNRIEFLLFCFLLLFVSFICINCNKVQFFLTLYSYFNYIYFLKQTFVFLKKQNLSNQANFLPSIRIFAKTNNASKR